VYSTSRLRKRNQEGDGSGVIKLKRSDRAFRPGKRPIKKRTERKVGGGWGGQRRQKERILGGRGEGGKAGKDEGGTSVFSEKVNRTGPPFCDDRRRHPGKGEKTIS